MDGRHSEKDPLRLMATGVAGTGKSRTVRSSVAARRQMVRQTAQRTRMDRVPGLRGGMLEGRRA
eukprot:7963095-Pyramimonas_sp.AAC.1